MNIQRKHDLSLLEKKLKDFPVVALLGPRQIGKTTLAHQFSAKHARQKVHFFDLEDPRDLALLDNPMFALENLDGLIVIDEIQRRPDLFPVLRVLADRKKRARFLILGSASRDLVVHGSESLAGRIGFLELGGFSLDILGSSSWQKLWIRGGYPRSFLAGSESVSFDWRQNFISTFLERDIPNLGITIPAQTLRRFWSMLSHYHGQIFSASEIGRSLGTGDTTVKRYLDILTGTFLIRALPPWFSNDKKRVVKRPKIYFRDTGLLHALLSLESMEDLLAHPKLGASWEGFAMEQTIAHFQLSEREIFFWAVHSGAELDLLFRRKGKLYGVEFKYNEAPRLTPSMRSVHQELSLAHLWIIYPGTRDYALDKKTSVVSLINLHNVG